MYNIRDLIYLDEYDSGRGDFGRIKLFTKSESIRLNETILDALNFYKK